METLIKRDQILSAATTDDDMLVSLLDDFQSLDNLSSYQKQHIRLDCVYLKKLYEIGIQHMNCWTWRKYSTEAISILNDAGFTHRVNERSLRTLNTKFRVQLRRRCHHHRLF